MTTRWIALVGFVLSAAGSAGAVTPPDVFRCEDRLARGITAWAGQHMRCIASCEQSYWKELTESGSTTRSCRGPVGVDLATQRCLDRANHKLRRGARRACPGATLPACGPYLAFSGNVSAYVNDVIAARIDDIRFGVLFNGPMCAFPDAVLLRNERMVTLALAKFGQAFGNCIGGCRKARDFLGDTSRSCLPPFDATTDDCVTKRTTKALEAAHLHLPTPPVCGVYPLGDAGLVAWAVATTGSADAIGGPSINPYCASPSGAFVD